MNAEECRELRARVGWTQKDLAAALGVSSITVARWEADRGKGREWVRGIPETTAKLIVRIIDDELERQRSRRKRKR